MRSAKNATNTQQKPVRNGIIEICARALTQVFFGPNLRVSPLGQISTFVWLYVGVCVCVRGCCVCLSAVVYARDGTVFTQRTAHNDICEKFAGRFAVARWTTHKTLRSAVSAKCATRTAPVISDRTSGARGAGSLEKRGGGVGVESLRSSWACVSARHALAGGPRPPHTFHQK